MSVSTLSSRRKIISMKKLFEFDWFCACFDKFKKRECH
jgi:hypothetical protein